MMEDIARKPNAKDYIERFSKVCFGGGTYIQHYSSLLLVSPLPFCLVI